MNHPEPNQLRETNCDVCGDAPSTELMALHGSAYHECDQCGLVFTKHVIDDYVEANEAAFAEELADYARKAEDKKRTKKLVTHLNQYAHLRQTNQFLEVGCNAGAVLVTARNLGWNVQGVDISKAATDYGKSKWGLDLHNGTLESAEFESNRFDVIYSNATLEHVEHPLSTLTEIAGCCDLVASSIATQSTGQAIRARSLVKTGCSLRLHITSIFSRLLTCRCCVKKWS